MKTLRISAYGFLLAVGMLLYSGLAFGAFQYLSFVAVGVWIPILLIIGFLVRRRFLHRSADASLVIGFGLLLYFMALTGIGALTGSGNILDSFWNSTRSIASIYGPWFWLPFVAGIALGGIRRKEQRKPCDAIDGNISG